MRHFSALFEKGLPEQPTPFDFALRGRNPGHRRDVFHFPGSPQEPTVQFSMTNLETRPNSRVLLVTSVKRRLRA